jgi:uncharacterized protein YcfL
MKLLLTIPLLGLVLAGGCVTHQETVQTPYPPVERPTVQDKRIVIDPALSKAIRIVGVKSSVGLEGFLKIQVNVQSMLDSFLQFRYRITWIDAAGNDLPMADSILLHWSLLAHETSFLGATSPTPSARSFRLTFLGPERQ